MTDASIDLHHAIHASIDQLRDDHQVSALKTLMSTLLFSLLICNIRVAAALLTRTAWRILFIGNLLQPIMGVHSGIVALLRELRPDLISCRAVLVSNVTALMLGVPLMLSVLYTKAYYGNRRPRWFVAVGGFMIGASVVVGITGFFLVSLTEHGYARCQASIARSWVLAKFSVDVSANLVLSYGFIAPLWRNCREYKDRLTEALMRDGVLYALGAILSNLICAILILVPQVKQWQMHIYATDYCLTSILICLHLRSFRRRLLLHHNV